MVGGASATVTFVFVDLVGSTDLLHRLGDDANDELTRRYQLAMREVVERHGGDVVRTMGDGLMVVFEHSVAGAAAAAVDMQRAVDRMGRADPLLRLQIRVGLSVGEATVVEGDWSGTPIFEAARLESKARPGSILVNDVVRVLLGTRGGFEFTPVGALELKGFPEPLPAAELAWEPDPGLPEVPLPAGLEAGLEWALVGRVDELAVLAGAWRSVVEQGTGGSVVVRGGPGVGKSRLVAELAVSVQSGSGLARGTVLYGSASDGGGAGPLAAFAEVLRWWAASVPPEVLRSALGGRPGRVAALVPSLAARLPELAGGAVATEVGSMVDAVVEVLVAIAGTRPLLVVVDDAHAADERTGEVVGALSAAEAPVLVVTCSRDDGAVGSADVVLGGLGEGEVGALLDQVVGRATTAAVPVEVVETAVAETGGVPRLVIEAGERLVASGALGLAAGSAREVAVRRALSGASPYRGLLAFQAEDADEFFGRDEDVAGVLARLAAGRLLAVVGASGSGKSSLVRAGVVPALARGALAGSADWPVVLFNAGPRPLLELAAGVARVVDRPVGEVLAAVESGPGGLDGLLRDASGDGGPARVVVVVDQFEEVFTLCRDEAERDRFAAALFHAAGVPGGRALVVVVLRGDFYGHCAELDGLGTAIEGSTVLLGPMDEAGLRQVIEGPARRADLVVEPGLAEAMIRDVAGQPGGLPLLSHALYETWERRRDRTLTVAGYREAGGAQGAIARTAEAVFTERLSADQQRVARGLFLALTELGEGTEDTRRRAPRAELVERAGSDAELDDVVELLVSARLVTVGDDTVEVAHEAVIREWPRLRDWLDEDREALRALRHLAGAAGEWDRGGRDPADLYRGPRLAAALDAAGPGSLTGVEREFLDASVAAEEAHSRAQARQNRRLRRLLVGVGVLLVGALLAGLVAAQQRNRADERTADADFQRLVSQSVDLAETNPSLAFLLALEANHDRDNAQSRSALFTTLQRNRSFYGYTPTDGVPTGATVVGDHQLVYATRDATVGFTDLDSGQALADPVAIGDPPDDPVTVFVADDPDATGRDPVVVARADTGRIVRVDPRTHTTDGEPIDTGQALFALAASTRLGLIAAGLEDGTVALFDLDTGTPAGALPAQSDPTPLAAPSGDSAQSFEGAGTAVLSAGDVIALAFSPTGRRLAVLRPDTAVEFWDPGSRRVIAASPGVEVVYAAALGHLVYRPDGRTLVGFDDAVDQQLFAVDASTGRSLWRTTLADFGNSELAFDEGGGTLYVAARGGAITARDPDDGSVVGDVIETRLGVSAALHVSAGGRLVAVSGGVPAAGSWDLGPAGPLVTPLVSDPSGRLGPFAIAPDGSSVLLSDLVNRSDWQLWDPRRGVRLAPLPDVVLAGFTGDTTLAAVFSDLTAGQYDIEAGRRVPPVIEFDAAGITGGIVAPDRGVLALGYEDGTVTFYDRSGGHPFPDLDTGAAAYVYALSPDGRLVAVGSVGDDVTVYETASGRVVAGPLTGVAVVEFSPVADHLFVSRVDGRLEEVALPSLEPVGAPFPPGGVGLFMHVSADGSLLHVVDRSNHNTLVDVAARAPVGDRFVLAPPAQVQSAALDPNGEFIVLGRDDGVETWDLAPERWREVACRAAGRNLTREEWDTYLPNAGGYRRTCPEWPAGS